MWGKRHTGQPPHLQVTEKMSLSQQYDNKRLIIVHIGIGCLDFLFAGVITYYMIIYKVTQGESKNPSISIIQLLLAKT